MLLGFSAFSHDRTLAPGEEKYFCELDCHLAYSVQNVERVKQIGDTVANGEFYVVTVRGRFDETTTAPLRPRDVPVTPNPLSFALVDGHGGRNWRIDPGPEGVGSHSWSFAIVTPAIAPRRIYTSDNNLRRSAGDARSQAAGVIRSLSNAAADWR